MRQQGQIKAGIQGEDVLSQLFSRVTFPFEYYIFHDLHLKSTGPFQIDALFLTPYYAIILEMKNIAGHIKIRKDHPQLERTLTDGQTDYFKNPVGQVVEITDLFKDFLQMCEVDLPIYSLIVFKDSNRSLQFEESQIPIFGPQEIPHFIRTRPRELRKLTPVEMSKLTAALITGHREYNPFPVVKNFFINPKDIIPGVLCGKCQKFSVEKLFREWCCRYCGKSTQAAYWDALNDYSMLIGPKINNREFRRFLQIENPKEASDILRRSNLERSGAKKNREYLLKYKN